MDVLEKAARLDFRLSFLSVLLVGDDSDGDGVVWCGVALCGCVKLFL